MDILLKSSAKQNFKKVMVTKFNICSRALNELGEDTISSFSDGTSASRTCSLVYPEYIKFLLSVTWLHITT